VLVIRAYENLEPYQQKVMYMRDTTLAVRRSGVTIRAGFAVQIQHVSWQEAMNLDASSPYDAFWIHTTGGGITDIRRGDLLIDENEVDPLTKRATQYRVFVRPRQLYEAYVEIQAGQIVGT
jgi:hypothetical protein